MEMLKSPVELLEEIDVLRARLEESEETLRAIRTGEVDALVVSGPHGQRVFSLRGAEQPYRMLIEQMSDGAATLTCSGTVLYGNRRLAALLRMPLENLVGQSLLKFVNEAARCAFGLLLQKAVREESHADTTLQAADGTVVPVHVSLSSIKSEGERLLCISITDLTARNRIEQTLREQNLELENAARAKDRFLASMSHELRTPLNAIIGFTGILLMGLPGPLNPEQEAQLGHVDRGAKHLLSLINDVLDLAKIESGKLTLTFEPVNCKAVVQDVFTSIRPMALEKALSLKVQMPDGDLTIRTNGRALTQILLNLSNNGVKFTEKGSVTIIIDPADNGTDSRVLRIHVIDTGCGIRAEDLPKLFKPFERAGATRREREPGTGLGLYLSQKLAELLGGKILVKSEPDMGSTFTLVLPGKELCPRGY